MDLTTGTLVSSNDATFGGMVVGPLRGGDMPPVEIFLLETRIHFTYALKKTMIWSGVLLSNITG